MDFINKRILDIHETTIKREKIDVIKSIEKISKKEKLEIFRVDDYRIEFLRSGDTFHLFRGNGRFMISLKEYKGKTSIICKILPYDGHFGYMIIAGIVLMSLWSVGVLLVNNSIGKLILITSWVISIGGTALSYFLNKLQLRSFYRYFVRKISKS